MREREQTASTLHSCLRPPQPSIPLLPGAPAALRRPLVSPFPQQHTSTLRLASGSHPRLSNAAACSPTPNAAHFMTPAIKSLIYNCGAGGGDIGYCTIPGHLKMCCAQQQVQEQHLLVLLCVICIVCLNCKPRLAGTISSAALRPSTLGSSLG